MKQKSLFSHPNPFQMDRKEHQFLVRKLLVPGVADILRNAAGAFVVFAAIAGDQGAEHFVMGIVFLLLFSLKYALRKKAQMYCKAAEIQCIPVKMAVVKVFHHLHAAIHKAGDIVHHAHGGVELCVDDVQRNKASTRRPKGLHGSAGG